jgi:hypothetical protein
VAAPITVELAMPRKARELFTPAVKPDKLNPLFSGLVNAPGHQAARELMKQVFADFRDVDHNFVREFQTGGFSARVFELALFAYIQQQGLALNRSHASPDFLIGGDLPVAIEVTTTNPAQDSPPEILALLPDDPDTAARAFVFQISKALGRKLAHRPHGVPYWD